MEKEHFIVNFLVSFWQRIHVLFNLEKHWPIENFSNGRKERKVEVFLTSSTTRKLLFSGQAKFAWKLGLDEQHWWQQAVSRLARNFEITILSFKEHSSLSCTSIERRKLEKLPARLLLPWIMLLSIDHVTDKIFVVFENLSDTVSKQNYLWWPLDRIWHEIIWDGNVVEGLVDEWWIWDNDNC